MEEYAVEGSAVQVGAPQSARPSLVRTRLLDRLEERWRRPLTVVCAGPGFGKTTLLAQMVEQNRRDSKGREHWLTCRREHASAVQLLTDIAALLDVELDVAHASSPPLDPIVNALAGRSPLHVGLVLDDVHAIAAASPGAAKLEELVDRLPANGHLVMGSRAPLPLPVARRIAAGHVFSLGETDLLFTDHELAAFATMRAASIDALHHCGGWPAEAELLVSAGPVTAVDYLWEEVLEALPDQRRRDLAVLATLGPTDDAVLSAGCGHPVVAADVVRAVPLSVTTSAGRAELHDLWRHALEPVLSTEERRLATVAAARAARDQRDLAVAAQLLGDAKEWQQLRSIAREVCSDSHPVVPAETLTVWYDQLREARAHMSPEGLLLAGAIRKPLDPLGSVPCFEEARRGFAAVGDLDGETACIFHLGHIFWWHEQVDGIVELFDRLTELAALGSELAAALVDVGMLIFSELAGDDATVAEAATSPTRTSLHPEIAPISDWLGARCALQLGDARRALPLAERAATTSTPTMRPVADLLVLACRWALGDAADVLATVDPAIEALDRLGWIHNRAADGAHAALWWALSGERQRARAHLDRATAVAGATGTWAKALLGIAASTLAVVDGDEARAIELLTAELAERPLTDVIVRRGHRPWVAISYVLIPATRGMWDEETLAGRNLLGRRLAVALVEARGGTDPCVGDLPSPLDAGVVRSLLPPPWVGELTAILEQAGRHDDASSLITDLATVHDGIVGAASSPALGVAAAADRLLRTAARQPAQDVSLALLGPLAVRIGSVDVWPDQLNRRAVRDLLGWLVEHGTTTRARVTASLWPDMDESAARNNLRAALSYLNRALEPNRPADLPPYFVRERGEQLMLIDDRHLAVDARAFRQCLAARRALFEGADDELGSLLDAIARYRGDYLADVDAEWAEAPRRELRVGFVRLAIRAGELLLTSRRWDEAEALADRARAAEPWSEGAFRVLAEARLGRGDRGGALRALVDCEAMLDDLGVAPETSTAMLRRRAGVRL